ncbi:hypothetical protein GCM10010222_47930 [Streptomyces tanashiensis]|uniref:Integral membrane protein n=1 Tax=Streptomyces tanashiensis TaxID=67367 RepID=A0ABY6QRD0_9ACTN|nr:hypothetical protein [Streptomyces tanashiensis]UZX20351.1 hypothetical protein LDH80_06340 [Streptomyces tanashiensis]GGT00723.1 hypothetical protein GCM10010222_47930 [Streptomyces tanashiensis]GGY55580.1 hypothetical protein GCM10010299_72410 [Streptomyces tanashiensis]
MRAARTLAVTATAFAALGLAAPLATATNGPSNVTVSPLQAERGGDGSNGVSVSPFAVHQGAILTVTVRGCAGGTVTSNAFATTTLSPAVNGVSTATPRIFNNATPGQYNLAVQCNGRTLTQPFRVLAGQGAQGGLGGSMAPSSTEMAIGGSLVAAAALGGGVFIARRRRMTGAGV